MQLGRADWLLYWICLMGHSQTSEMACNSLQLPRYTWTQEAHAITQTITHARIVTCRWRQLRSVAARSWPCLKTWKTTGWWGATAAACRRRSAKKYAARSPRGGSRIADVGGRIDSVSCPSSSHSWMYLSSCSETSWRHLLMNERLMRSNHAEQVGDTVAVTTAWVRHE